MSLVMIVTGSLMRAVWTARGYVDGLQQATGQGQFVADRIRWAVDRAGVYQIGSSATVVGVAVVWTTAMPTSRPDTLVVWTSGREGSLADQGTITRLPKANELVIYTPDPAAPHRLVEIVPTVTDQVDFTSAGFAAQIRQLIASSAVQKVAICDRLRRAPDSSGTASAVRFEAEPSPTDIQITAAATGTSAWQALPWAGLNGSSWGLRQILVRMELQLVTASNPVGNGSDPALPVFGAATKRYLFRK